MSPRDDDNDRARPEEIEPTHRRPSGTGRHGRGRGQTESARHGPGRSRSPRWTGSIPEAEEDDDVSDEGQQDPPSGASRHDRHRARRNDSRSYDQDPQDYELESTPVRWPSVPIGQPVRHLATSRMHGSQSIVTQQASFTPSLNSLGITFVSIPVGEYAKCIRFITENQSVLEHDENQYLREAVAALRSNKIQYARSCIQQGLLLRKINGLSGKRRQQFVTSLADEDDDAVRAFTDDFDTTFSALTAAAGTTTPRVPQRERGDDRMPQSQELGKNPKREGGISSGMNTLALGASSGRRPSRYHDLPREDMMPGDIHQAPRDRHQRVSFSDRRSIEGSLAPSSLRETSHETSRGTHIFGTKGDKESLDERYYKRSPAEAGRFFKVGRVFSLLFSTNAGNNDKNSYPVRFGERVHSETRFMAVVRENHGNCWAVPINTYGGKGVAKSGLDQADIDGHAVIHMSHKAPYTAPDEPRMVKVPIKVDPAGRDQELDRMSRINFTKVHTIEHNVKVMHIGMVAQASRPYFINYWNAQAAPPR